MKRVMFRDGSELEVSDHELEVLKKAPVWERVVEVRYNAESVKARACYECGAKTDQVTCKLCLNAGMQFNLKGHEFDLEHEAVLPPPVASIDLAPIKELEPEVFELPCGFRLTAKAAILPQGHLGKSDSGDPLTGRKGSETGWSVGLELYWKAVGKEVWFELRDFEDWKGFKGGDSARAYIQSTVERFRRALRGG